MQLHSIGHGNRSLPDLIASLQAFGIVQAADVRSFPGSRRHPHFGRDALERSLPSAGIAYTWMPGLGGRRPVHPDSVHTGWRVAGFRGYADYMESDAFRAALRELVDAASTRPTAFMCAERLWWQCHRRLLSDALVIGGHQVVHILDAAKSEPHRLTEFLHIEGDQLLYRGLL
jgi:uncharacterized protein (DUF488 family)